MTPPLFPHWWGQVGGVLSLRYARPILAAAAPLEQLIRKGGKAVPLDRALTAHTRSRRMGKNDRALLSLAVYGFSRNREGILRALSGVSSGEGTPLALGLLDQLTPDRLKDAAELFPEAAEAHSRLQDLRQEWTDILSRVWECPLTEAEIGTREALSALFSVPPFWFDMGPWRRVGEASAELTRGRFPQKPHLRVNTLRGSREDVIDILRQEGIQGRPSPRSPWGIVVEERAALSRSRVLREGFAEIQDEGSQLVALACRDQAVGRVLDLCAGAGGKALALAALLGEGTRIFAHDADPDRLAAAATRLARAGAKNVLLAADFTEVRSQGPYDLVLIDAPCSSTGTMRRNPDVAWRWEENDIRSFASTQECLLKEAGGLIRPGGLLVYATCSLLTAENDSPVQGFLNGDKKFQLEPLPSDTAWEAVVGGESGMMRLPLNLSHYEGDGFFLCRMRRRS